MGMWFRPTGMEKNSKIDCHSDAVASMTWGGAVWGLLDGVMAMYEGISIGTYYVFDKGRVESPLLANLQVQEEEKEHLRWECVAAVALWGLWRSRCKLIFQDIHEPEAVVIKAIWV
mgnify:CR=1 FL=1